MYAIIKTGGKQIKVKVGQAIYVEKPNAKTGEKVVLDKVILIGGESTKVSAPTVAGTTAEGAVKKYSKQRKVVTSKYKPKKRSHRKQGHHQLYTKVVIGTINA